MEIKKETRNLGIKGFRNIGFDNETEKEERLILNYSLDKDLIGDLVILIGPNNAGKSNVLDAITSWKNNDYDNERNKSDVFLMDSTQHPLVELFSLVGDKKILVGPELAQLVNSFTPPSSMTVNDNPDSFSLSLKNGAIINADDYVNAVDYAKDTWPRYGASREMKVNFDEGNFSDLIHNILLNLIKLEKSFDSTAAATIGHLKQDKLWGAFLTAYESYLKNNRLDHLPKAIVKIKATNSNADLTKYTPQVIKYEEHHISNRDLICSADKIQESEFFNALLKMMGSDIKELKTTYDKLHKNNSRGILTHESRQLTKKLAKISQYFNELYCLDKDKYQYKFMIQLNPEDICFSIFKQDEANSDENEVSLFLDFQSTGFRWFFDLFFNVFATNTLQCGDIIIMDEPATNLHVYGQVELRKFLKEFAITHGVTFVIATHSPFMVNLDYLDEIRIITTHDQNVASIENNFSVINAKNDPDSLAAIRKSLTVTNNVIINEDQIVVFVEGITDYNYLTGIKNWLNDKKYEQLTFLPVQGLGVDTEDRKNRLNKLQNIHHLNSVFLTDGDFAGQEFSQLNSATMHPFRLISLNKLGFNEIEDLFAYVDQAKFGIIKEETKNNEKWNKNTINSVCFKKMLYKDSLVSKDKPNNPDGEAIISNETRDNFKKVFDAIINLVQKPN